MRLRRYFLHLLTALCDLFSICLPARHLAIYLLDVLMDHHDIPVQQLHVVSLACLSLASKFEERQRKFPRLKYLNDLACMRTENVVLDKEGFLRMELAILEKFSWNLCIPTPAHYIDYYLCTSIGESDYHSGWPISLQTDTKALLGKYAYYFLEASVQDPSFLCYRPSVIAAACVCASRVRMQISPAWSTRLELLTLYSWENLAQCTERLLMLQ
ncbi:cyclin-J-like [Rhynochetos jubatus]